MRKGLIPFTVVALAAGAVQVSGQVYPERIRAVARASVEAEKVERYQRRDREEQTERFTKTVRIGGNGPVSYTHMTLPTIYSV